MAATRLNTQTVWPGQTLTLTFTFSVSDTDTSPWTPATVVVTVEAPDGTSSTPSVTQVANVATVVYTPSAGGVYIVRVVGAANGGVGPSAKEWFISVEKTQIF